MGTGRWNAFVGLACCVAAGCDSGRQAPPGEPPAPIARATPAPAPPAPLPAASASAPPPVDGLTGVLGEEEFARLHTLKDGSAPPRRGAEVSLEGGRAYLSLPARGRPPLPGVVVIHEWWGLNEHVQHWADRLAEDGYAALAVDLYGGQIATTREDAMKLMKAVDPSKATRTLVAASSFLERDGRIAAPRTAAVGWCFGGKWSLELALASPDIDAVVVYYGHVSTDSKHLASLKAPLLGIFGNRDEGIPPAMVDRFDAALRTNGARYTLLRYDAEHAFANPSSARYDHAAAADAWTKVRAFLREHLQARN